MKKRFAEMMSIMMVFMLAACGSSSAAEKKDTSAERSVKETTEETKEEKEVNEAPASGKNEVLFEEFTPIDNDECTVMVKELVPDSIWGYTVKVVYENKSADKTYMFAVEEASVNNVEVGTLAAKEVAPGKKSNDEITLSANELKENGITDFTDIGIMMRIYDSDDWSADPVAKETFHIYPFGEDKAESFVREGKDTDTVLIDDENISVIVTGYDPNSIWGYSVNLYFVNKTDKNIMFSVEDASVNGYMADPFYANSLMAGKSEFSPMSWSKTTLEENDITDVESIEFKLRVYDYDDWMADNFAEETFTLTP